MIEMAKKSDIDRTRAFLKDRLLNDNITFHGSTKEFNQIKELISKTAQYGESNSALLIGPRRSGKSTVSLKNIYLT